MSTKKTEAKDIEKKQDTSLATYGEGAWGAGETSSQEDIILPKILCMQAMSELVTSGQAKMGEFRSSLDGTVLGDEKRPVEFITFLNSKTWTIMTNKKFSGQVAFTPENESWPLEEVDDKNNVIQRDKSLNFYCLLASDIAKQEAFPFVISFRRTSYTAGKKLTTELAKLKMFRQPSATVVFTLSCTRETNDKGTFMVLDVNKVRKSTSEEIAACWQWYQALGSAKNVKIDEGETAQEAAPEPKTAPKKGKSELRV